MFIVFNARKWELNQLLRLIYFCVMTIIKRRTQNTIIMMTITAIMNTTMTEY